jgi:hypothetical protein
MTARPRRFGMLAQNLDESDDFFFVVPPEISLMSRPVVDFGLRRTTMECQGPSQGILIGDLSMETTETTEQLRLPHFSDNFVRSAHRRSD